MCANVARKFNISQELIDIWMRRKIKNGNRGSNGTLVPKSPLWRCCICCGCELRAKSNTRDGSRTWRVTAIRESRSRDLGSLGWNTLVRTCVLRSFPFGGTMRHEAQCACARGSRCFPFVKKTGTVRHDSAELPRSAGARHRRKK